MAFGHLRRSLPSGSVLTPWRWRELRREREQIRNIAESFRPSEVDLSAVYQEVLLANRSSAVPVNEAERRASAACRQISKSGRQLENRGKIRLHPFPDEIKILNP